MTDYDEQYNDGSDTDDPPYNSNDSCYDPAYEAAYYGRIYNGRRRKG